MVRPAVVCCFLLVAFSISVVKTQHVGDCPVPNPGGMCGPPCASDGNCSPRKKCCPSVCGHTCMEPIGTNSVTADCPIHQKGCSRINAAPTPSGNDVFVGSEMSLVNMLIKLTRKAGRSNGMIPRRIKTVAKSGKSCKGKKGCKKGKVSKARKSCKGKRGCKKGRVSKTAKRRKSKKGYKKGKVSKYGKRRKSKKGYKKGRVSKTAKRRKGKKGNKKRKSSKTAKRRKSKKSSKKRRGSKSAKRRKGRKGSKKRRGSRPR